MEIVTAQGKVRRNKERLATFEKHIWKSQRQVEKKAICNDKLRKEHILLTLDMELAQSEEQYMMALRSHIQNLDLFVGMRANFENEQNKWHDSQAI